MAALRWLGIFYAVLTGVAALVAVFEAELVFAMLAAAAGVAAILCFALDKGLTLLAEIRDAVRGEEPNSSESAPMPHVLSAGTLEGLEDRLARARGNQA